MIRHSRLFLGLLVLGVVLTGCKTVQEAAAANEPLPPLVSAGWLADRLNDPGVKVIDLRPQADYNGGHIPGALGLNVENLRGTVGGVPSMLLPAPLLAAHASLLGLVPADTVILVYGQRPMDATLASMALERLGHARWAILDGGFNQWKADARPLSTLLPAIAPSRYPVPKIDPDRFTVDAAAMAEASRRMESIVDVRPIDYFTGRKSDEARGGHIPGAKNCVFSQDLVTTGGITRFKPVAELRASYGRLFPDRDAPVYVHCRTGHQASQTYFVLHRLLGYKDVKWYDGSWTEWSARPDLPVAKE